MTPALRTVRLSTELDAPPDAVWDALLRIDTFRYITRGYAGFTGIDSERLPEEGQTFEVRMWLFHAIPSVWTHHLTIETLDAKKRLVQSREHGGPIRTWDHRITVEETPGGRSLYTDEVAIDAGALTGAVVWFAKRFFRHRQARWRDLARTL